MSIPKAQANTIATKLKFYITYLKNPDITFFYVRPLYPTNDQIIHNYENVNCVDVHWSGAYPILI